MPGKRDDGYPAEQEGNGTETPAGDPSEKMLMAKNSCLMAMKK